MKSVMEVRAVAIVLVVLSITSAVHGAFNPILTVDSCTKSKLVLNVTEASSSGIIYIQGQTSVCKQDTYNGSHIHEFDFASCGISWANSFKVIVQKKSLYQTGDDKQIPIMCVADLSDLTVANGINALDKDDDAGQNLTVKPTALMKLFKNGVDVSGGNVQLTDILTMSIELDSEFLDDFDIMAMSCYASTINIINTDCAVDTELFPNFQKPITGIISAAFGAFRTTDLMGGSVGMTFSCTLKVCLGSCPPDVACRGLDLPNVRWIVQYTAPVSTSDYVHRVGRTARAGKLGHSLLFLLPSEVEFVAHLNKGKIGLEELQMDSVLGSLLGNMADLEKGNIQREPPRTYEEAATYLQMCVEQYVHDNSRVMDRAVQGFQSFVKAYATYPSDMKSIFHVKHLHLGHVAKSFGLRESPSGIKSSGTKRQHGKHGYKEHDRLKSKKRTVISEFGSGLNESGKLAKLNKIYQKSKKHEGKK